MSLSLLPCSTEPNDKQLDHKQKKYQNSIFRALEKFDTVIEWADYIASLGTLLKALQSWSPKFQNVKYYVPYPYQVSRRLASSLSINLPAGVHQKTLEVYGYIFDQIGEDELALQFNIWLPGILPLMSYASISLKPTLIELYENYILKLPSSTLRILAKSLLASLLPGIDDESSEFLKATMMLIETLMERLQDDSLFWQSCFQVMITNPERRLGAVVWLTKKLPSLNAVPHLMANAPNIGEDKSGSSESIQSTNNRKKLKGEALSMLLPEACSIVSPEPGLLIRGFIRCLEDKNDTLVKRGILDLLVQRMRLDSPVLTTLISVADQRNLILACIETTLAKDMSLNRRIWNWFLGPTSSFSNATTYTEDNGYFLKNGLVPLKTGLMNYLETEKTLGTALKIFIASMDRWEIGSLIIPDVFIPSLKATQRFENREGLVRLASTFFDSVETNIIWGKIYEYVFHNLDLEFLDFILNNFNISSDEEIVVKHLPFILLALFCLSNKFVILERAEYEIKLYYTLLKKILDLIPDRAFLPLDSFSQSGFEVPEYGKILSDIEGYYNKVSDPLKVAASNHNTEINHPYSREEVTFLIVNASYRVLFDEFEKSTNSKLDIASRLFISIHEKLPETEANMQELQFGSNERKLIEYLSNGASRIFNSPSNAFMLGLVELYSSHLASHVQLTTSVKILKLLMISLWTYFIDPRYQLTAIHCLQKIERSVSSKYVQDSLTFAFVSDHNLNNRITALRLLWDQVDMDVSILSPALELVLEELLNDETPHHITVSKWILTIINDGSVNRLFNMVCDKIIQYSFLERNEFQFEDDLDMLVYYLKILTAILQTNDGTTLKSFSAELTSIKSLEGWKGEDVSTYKNLILAISMRFLRIKNNTHTTSIRGILLIIDLLIDGSEPIFNQLLAFLLRFSSRCLSMRTTDSDLIAVSILDIVTKGINKSFEDDSRSGDINVTIDEINLTEYLITNVSNMKGTLVITSYINLLAATLKTFDRSIFKILLSLTASIVGATMQIFADEQNNGGAYQMILLLLEGLEDVLSTSHEQISIKDKESYFANSNARTDFLQAVVSNVFSNESTTEDAKSQGERNILLHSFTEATNCCLDIWQWAQSHLLNLKDNEVNHNFSQYKFKSKRLLEKLYTLEPLHTIEIVISRYPTDLAITLTYILNGNRPSLTIPYIFHGIIYRHNRNNVIKTPSGDNMISRTANIATQMVPTMLTKLDSTQIIQFLIAYTDSLENSVLEEFYDDIFAYFKEITINYTLYDTLLTKNLYFISVLTKKVHLSKFGENKKVRRELSDFFSKLLGHFLNVTPKDNDESLSTLELIVKTLSYLLNEDVGQDKYNSTLSSIVGQVVSPILKSEDEMLANDIFFDLLIEISRNGSKVKNWRTLIYDNLQDDKKFHKLDLNKRWRTVILEWSSYPDNSHKLINDMVLNITTKRSSVTPTLIPFNSWGESENLLKKRHISRLCYLIMIAPSDTYLLSFDHLIGCILQFITSNNHTLKGRCLLLLRCMILRFSNSHFSEHWAIIVYSLQVNLQECLEHIEYRKQVNHELLLQVCKTLDLLLTLNIEGFVATNEWIFIIDTINCIYKNQSYVALCDKIADFKELDVNSNLPDLITTKHDKLNKPLLFSVRELSNFTQLKSFFHSISYRQYERNYSMLSCDVEACEEDAIDDIFV